MTRPILNDALPVIPWLDPPAWRLPGVQPLGDAPWLMRTEVFAQQVALRDRLVDACPEAVLGLTDRGHEAATECLETVLGALSADPDYHLAATEVRRPDGVTVALDRDRPMATLARLVQEDICLMEDDGAEYVLTAAALCFPAGWTLAEKLGRPLSRIHAPVPEYDDRLAARVDRIFRAIRPDRPLWRANALLYDDHTLHAPRREADPRRAPSPAPAYVRSERQTFRRLPRTGAVVFGILTSVIEVARLPGPAQKALTAAGLDRV